MQMENRIDADLTELSWSVDFRGHTLLEGIAMQPQDLPLRPTMSDYTGCTYGDIGRGQTDLFLCPQTPMQEGKPYWPFKQETALFRIFADIRLRTADGDPGDVLDFAEQYGLLGIMTYCLLINPDQQTDSDHWMDPIGESYRIWEQEIRWMRTAIILARAALAEDVEVLRDTVSIEPDRAVVRDRDGTKLTLSRRNLQVDDLLGSVRKVLVDVVNRRLEPLTHTSLIQQASGGSTPGLVCWPTSLLGGLWLQFARTMWTYRDQKKCKKCDRWFEQGPKDTRLERVFCSTRCKSQDYRARQQLARVMLRHGMSFEDVSRLIGSDLKTVKRWSAMNTKSPKETK